MTRDIARRNARPARSLLALAVGAVAAGALAVGAVAIGQMVIGRLAIGKARFKSLEIDELTVRKLRVIERLDGELWHLLGQPISAALNGCLLLAGRCGCAAAKRQPPPMEPPALPAVVRVPNGTLSCPTKALCQQV